MKLQGRKLSLRLRGEDVGLLQGELRQLRFAIEGSETGGQVFGDATLQAVLNFQQANRLAPTGVVDQTTAARINAAVDSLQAQPEPGGGTGSQPLPAPHEGPREFSIQGQIRQADGSPLVGATVRAFDQDMRHEETLGETVTDGTGQYEIKYTTPSFQTAEKYRADLVVRVFDSAATQLVSSSVIFNAPVEVTIDLM